MNGEAKVITLPINDVLPNRFQPRIKFDENKIAELSDSIKKYGVIQPIIVRNIGDKYEIIAGERRYKASVLAGLSEIPAIVNNLDDKDSSEVALIENVQRENLTPIEEAISYKKIRDMGGLTQESLATKLGVSQSAVANKLRLLHLSEAAQEALLDNKISERHARSLLKIKDEAKQVEMLNRIMKERLTVRKTDEEIEKIVKENNKPSEKNDAMGPTKEEIEILNILNSYKKTNNSNPNQEKIEIDKKEESVMNPNDPMNQFDIPEVNIIDDTPPVAVPDKLPIEKPVETLEPTSNIVPVENKVIEDISTQTGVEENANPGFMDIDRIAREAVDIEPKDSGLAPMDSLLTPNSIPVKEEPKMEPQTNVPQGRFFDVMPSMENAQNQNMEINIPSNNDFTSAPNMFGQIPLEPVPTQVAQPQTLNQQPIGNILEDPIIEPINIAPIQPEPVRVDPVSTPISEPATHYESFEPVDQSNMVDSLTVELPQAEPVSPIMEPAEISPNQLNSVAQPIGMTVEASIPQVNEEIPTLNLNDTPDIPVQAPIEVPIPSIVEPIVEPIQEGMSPINIEPITEPMNQGPAIQIPSMESLEMREIKDIILNAVDELNRLGYRAKLNEADLQNIYEFTISVEKDN